LLLGLATALAFLTKHVFVRYGFQLLRAEAGYNLFSAFDTRAFLDHFLECLHNQPVTLTLFVVHLAAGLLLTLAWLRHRDAGPDRALVVFASATLLAAPLSNLGAIVATGMTVNPALDRYLHACFVLPYLAAGLWLALAPWRSLRMVGRLVPLGVASFALYLVSHYLPQARWEQCRPPYPPEAQALDDLVRRHGPLRGVGNFWASRRLSYLTRQRVPIRTVEPWGYPYLHASSIQAYLSGDPRDTALPDYQLVVFGPDDGRLLPLPEEILREYGEPEETIEIGEFRIWRYQRLVSRRWEMFLRSQLAQRLRRLWAFQAPDEPATLGYPKNNLARWDHSGHILVPAGQSLEVRFRQPITGKLLDVSANFLDQYRLTFYQGAEVVATTWVPPVFWSGCAYDLPGMQSRLVPLPPPCRTQAWDRVLLTPVISHECASVGHFLVYQEDLPYRPDRTLVPGEQRRYEGEHLYPGSPDVVLAADPSASRGRVQQAPAGHTGYLTRGPACFLAPGRYRVDFAVAIVDAVPGEVATIDVTADGCRKAVRSRALEAADFPGPGRFTIHSLTLDVTEELEAVEFHVKALGKTAIALDYVDLTCLGAPATGLQMETDNPSSRPR
jgi:hypothetical protein